MKTVLLTAAAVIGFASAASAQSTVRFYGANGKSLGSATTYGNTTNFYSASGSRTMSATRYGNTTNFYNSGGRRIGSAPRWCECLAALPDRAAPVADRRPQLDLWPSST